MQPVTEWRDVTSGYEVSNHGEVRNKRTLRVLKGTVTQGYRVVRLSGQMVRVHTAVCTAFNGPRPQGRYACHKDGNSVNNAASNLYWGTPSANSADSVRHGTHTQTRKTRCPRNHLLMGRNLRPTLAKKGYRSCYACHLAVDTASNALRRGKAPVDVAIESDRRYAGLLGDAS